jgi:hypothetical protein
MTDEIKDDPRTRDVNWGACTVAGCNCTDYIAPATSGGHCQNQNCKHSATWHEAK